MEKQVTMRLRLSESVKLSRRARAWEEERINGKFQVERPDLARKVKESIRSICYEITNCAPAAVAAHMHPARVLKALGEFIMAERLCDETESARSARNLAHPLTLADYVEALELTIQHHRQPANFVPDDQITAIATRLECVAAMVCKLCSVAGIVDESEVSR